MTKDQWFEAVPSHPERLPDWIEVGRPLWDDVEEMGNDLKDAAHAALYQDLAHTERLARGLIVLGKQVERENLIALGEMALGDALRTQNRMREGYALLERAAERFEAMGDEVGWARTRIGWLGNLHDLDHYPPPQPIIERAYEILDRHQKLTWLSGLCSNAGYFYTHASDYEQALKWGLRSLLVAQRIEKKDERETHSILAMLQLLDCYVALGRYEEAEQEIKRMIPQAEARKEVARELYVEVLAQVGRYYLNTGRYVEALSYLYQAQRLVAPPSWWYYDVNRHIAAAYLRLNRLQESESLLRDLLERIDADFDSPINPTELLIRILFTRVLVIQKRWTEAWHILEPAIGMLERMPRTEILWMLRAHQYRLLLLHHLGEEEALPLAREKLRELMEQTKEPFHVTEGYLCQAEVAESVVERESALGCALEACQDTPWLRWNVLWLTSQLTGDPGRRREALVQAADDLDTVQSSLAASFHASYLSQAATLYHDLIALYLEEGETTRAWETLERAKSRALLNSMMYRAAKTEQESSLRRELERLQVRHYGLVNARLEGCASDDRLPQLEREISELQEAIQVETLGRREPLAVPPPIVPEAPPESDLIGYFLVRDEVHAFVHNGQTYHHLQLPTTPAELNSLSIALSLNMRATPAAPDNWVPSMVRQLDAVLSRLDTRLIDPLRPFLRHEKVVVVPHGLLHQLPFSLLRHEGGYLLERRSLRMVPTARLVAADHGAWPGTPARQHHLVVSHSWDGRLQQTRVEAEMVARILGNAVVLDGAAATRRNFREAVANCDVLHIAAHGEHRADAPQFSCIQFEDGQLNASDLFHLTLHSSLVTLSACDTGQVVVYPGDDPVGLWRSFLAAGARSLLVSLWQLQDDCALRLMRGFYERLVVGESKVAALRAVQLEWVREAEGRWCHPFYWGALQLIGDDGMLSLQM